MFFRTGLKFILSVIQLTFLKINIRITKISKTVPAFKEFEKVVLKTIWPQKSNFLLDETVGVLILYPYLAKMC